MKTVIFDLDGTLSDPSVGIAGAINHSLERMGMDKRPRNELLRFIGPPLLEIFNEIMPKAPEKGIAFFREYYRNTGFRQNVLYPGIREVLETLEMQGFRLCIATGKKTVTALDVLHYFGISHYFSTVLGCGDSSTKQELLHLILGPRDMNAVMIGDRGVDFAAADAVGIPSIGVRWGFGNCPELALATVRVNTPYEISEVVSGLLEE